LSIARATFDVAIRIIKLNISRKEEAFRFKPKGTEQCHQVRFIEGLKRDAMTPDKNPSAAENFSMKFTRHVNNVMPAATSSPVAPAT
jgi:hypothetical protein